MRGVYENSEDILIQSKVLKGFNNVLDILRTQLGIEGSIMSLERGLINPEGLEMFQDYFKSPHSKLREESGFLDAISITKINFFNGDSVILSTKFEPSLRGKGIIFLDLIKEKLNPYVKVMLDNKLREIHLLESQHFNNKRKLIEDTKNNLIKSI